MNPTVRTPMRVMWAITAVAICASLCGVLNAQRRRASTGSMIAAEPARLIIGVSASATTSSSASEFGVRLGPRITST
jgi:hypothetical protein